MVSTTVTGVAPLPQALVRLASDALNQLRSTLEHVLYAEIEHRSGGASSSENARAVEVPCTPSANDLQKWAEKRPRRGLTVLQPGTALYRRIADLQPFQRRDSQDAHPLKILVAHTNHSKHRTPSLAATFVADVRPDEPSDDIQVTPPLNRPIEVGDILAIQPVGRVVEAGLWPKIAIRRPHTNEWIILIHELRDLESWVRRSAVPLLITGSTDVCPLPPHLDITVGYADFRTALSSAGPEPAADRLEKLLLAEMAREALPGLLLLHPHGKPHGQALAVWAAALTDEEAIRRFNSLNRPATYELDAIVRAMIDEALTPDQPQQNPVAERY
ncbi:hypothetical protein AB0K48_07405 [Nonomuraea sp. NPDC055795]